MKLGTFLSMILGLMILNACSSTPRTAADIGGDRESYVEYAEERIDQWEDRADDMDSEARKRDLMASVNDARAELRGLQNAPDASWSTYRDRLESAFNRMNETYGRAE